MSEPVTTPVPTPPPGPAMTPSAPKSGNGTKAFASNDVLVETDQDKADRAKRDEAVEAQAAAYDAAGESDAAAAVRAKFSADASA